LTNEVKTTKEQIKTLLEKGKHDDELIEALLVFMLFYKLDEINNYNFIKSIHEI
jgi:hypothetical protein